MTWLNNPSGNSIVESSFKAIKTGKKASSDLNYATRLKAGFMSDRIVARQKGFSLQGKPASRYERLNFKESAPNSQSARTGGTRATKRNRRSTMILK